MHFVDGFEKFGQEVVSFVMSVRLSDLSVRVGYFGYYRADFHDILCLMILRKSAQKV
jgi:hypothetical protein